MTAFRRWLGSGGRGLVTGSDVDAHAVTFPFLMVTADVARRGSQDVDLGRVGPGFSTVVVPLRTT